MNQRQIDRAVASATGESLHTIRRRGFSIVRPPDERGRADWSEAGAEVKGKETPTSEPRQSAVSNSAA